MTADVGGAALLRDSRLNKFTAFSEAERDALGLTGLLPDCVESADVQLQRELARLAAQPSDLDRYLVLSALQDTNQTLFYRLIMSDPARFLPLVYTPTVGDACLNWSRLIARPKGLYLSIKRRGEVRKVLRNWPRRDVRFIVVTSGERVLGLGDLGANGMGIPIGKLALYTAAGAVPPECTLPIMLDTGTNNDRLLQDPMYIGLRQRRIAAAPLDEFVDEFVGAVQDEVPDCCIQFEDWGRADAFRLLGRYRDRVCCFNDDIQGSGAVALAGIISALRITGGRLADQKFLFLGAGSAGIGIAYLLVHAMTLAGLTAEQARARVWLFDSKGLLESTRTNLFDYQQPYAHPHPPTADFAAAVRAIQPTAVIGASTAAKAFDRRVIEAMAQVSARPIIFALSNPTSRSECTADEAYAWSNGRAIFASGSPFPPTQYGSRSLVPGQCNNMYIFPAIGLAVYATRARRVTVEMLVAAAEAVAEQVTAADLESGLIYPRQAAILKTETQVAKRVARVVFARGLAGIAEPADVDALIESHMYRPEYRSMV